jgi:hypothetical protein
MSTTSRWSSVSNAKTREKFGRHIVADFVDDSVGVLADTILLLARQLLGAGATRFVCQGIDASQNPGHILLRNTAQIFGDGLPEKEPISSLAPSGL